MRLAVIVIVLASALAAFACGDGGLETGTPSPRASGPAPSPTPEPTPVPPLNPTEEAAARAAQFDAIDFIDARTGWAAGYTSIVATTDGGATWQMQESAPPDAPFVAIDFVDAQTGFAVGTRYADPRTSTLLATTDGGRSWTPRPAPPAALQAIQFMSADDGWAVTAGASTMPNPGALLRTTDGGATWAPAASAPANSVCFGDATNGWVAGGRDVFRTTDGGRTWAPSFTNSIVTGGGAWLSWLRCFGSDVAWALFTDGIAAGSQGYVLYRTLDGGASWEPVIAGPIVQFPGVHRGDGSYAGPFDVLDANNTYFVGRCPNCAQSQTSSGTSALEVTSDAGRTWQPPVDIPGIGSSATDLTFVDREHGWLTSWHSIFATADGGRTWTKQYPQ